MPRLVTSSLPNPRPIARPTRPKVDRGAALAARLTELVERGKVAACQVDHVDVVTHARAVGGVVVIAEDRELGPPPHADLADEGHPVIGDA